MAYLGYKEEFKCNAFLISRSNALVPAHFLKSFWLDYPPPNFTQYYIVATGYENGLRNERCEIEQVEHLYQYRSNAKEINLPFNIAVIKVDNYL